MSRLGFQVELKGKLFSPTVDKQLVKALNKGITRMALVSEERVKSQLWKGHGVVTGHLRRSISGELVRDLVAQTDAGAVRQGANVVYATWIEGTSKRNKTTSFKGYRMFDKARRKLKGELVANTDKYFVQHIKKALI
jgi:hypothetical protein